MLTYFQYETDTHTLRTEDKYT